MYKKFLVSMLLTAALVGCNHQPSDKQGDQSDTTTTPVQDQMVNPENSSGSDAQMSVSPQPESTQTPSDDATAVTPATPITPSEPSHPADTAPKATHDGDSSSNNAATGTP
ncbi:hypothetical protein [Rickettsiella grylli]|uniref:Transmembrane protein 108 n=1 Tax=Rickettsiella grylli TaxID=59196 RepID=A8PMW0_9COXI|nr:hypothetical protein [Rickettsiella grylli]EDP46214.1 putative transmembrane protein 108 [Rickettsiella grylli]